MPTGAGNLGLLGVPTTAKVWAGQGGRAMERMCCLLPGERILTKGGSAPCLSAEQELGREREKTAEIQA